MDCTEKLEQRLRQLQSRCNHLTQQLEAERTAAAAIQANLTRQIDQQAQRLLALEAQVNTDIGDRPPPDAAYTPTDSPIQQELQRIAEENRQFRQTLDTQADTYRHLFDCNPQPMLVYDLETLRFLAVNEAMIAKYGYSRAEFLAMTIADIRPPEDVPRLLENVANVDSGLDMAGLWQHRLRDGRIIQVEIVSYALEFEGRRAELVMAHDVTQRVHAEQALHDLNRSLEQTVAERTAALCKSQTELQAILNNTPAKLFVEDLQGRYIFVNQTFLRLFNCQPEDVLGKSMHEFFPPHIADAFRANDRLLLEQGGVQQFEEIMQVNGEDRVFLSNKFLLRDDQGEVYAICGMSTDINDRKAMEEELQESRDRLQAMLAAVPDLVFRVNRDGQYLDFYPSHSTVDVTGLDNLVGQNLTEVLPPDLAQAHLHRIEHVLLTQTMQVSEQHIPVNGKLRREEVRVAPCGANEVLFVVRDITERKQAELALQASQHLMQTVLDTTPIGIFWKNRDGVYQGNNRAAAELLGLTDAPILTGQTDADLPWNPETLAMIQSEDRQIMATDMPCLDILQSFTLENDTQLWLETNKVPLKDGEGNVIGIVGTAQDVTQRKRDEMERQSLTDRLTLALQAGACGTWDWDMVHDALWDERMYEIYGLQNLGRAATYQDWRDRVHPDDISGVEARLQSAMCDEIPFNVEFRIWRTDGALRWVQAIAQLQHDSQGIPIRMVGINQDITSRKQAELDLEAYAERVEDLYNNAPCGYYSLDAESRITSINHTALRWLDYPREAVWGQPLTQFITEVSCQIFAEQRTLLTQAMQEKNLEYEIVLVSRTGEQMNVLISEEVQKNVEGTLLSSRATMTDIRQRLQAERKLQQQYARENLLRQVTARIRQSLDLSTIF
ncbi:MAG: PAS domain S-box protein, partial [Leptolyngbyaceae bacterium]|nr:PAS domain S-box protein [Leptolyngbyaceae bacterium]